MIKFKNVEQLIEKLYETQKLLKGAGFKILGERGGGEWSRQSRPRVDTHPTQTKWMWEIT